jgi:hypothetical protein
MTFDGSADLAVEIRRRGLAAPARLLLEAHRPLRPLLGDLATFLSPLLRPVLGGRVTGLGATFGDDVGIERLIDQLAGEDAD